MKILNYFTCLILICFCQNSQSSASSELQENQKVLLKAHTRLFHSSLDKVRHDLDQKISTPTIFICYAPPNEIEHTHQLDTLASDLIRSGIKAENLYYKLKPGGEMTKHQYANLIFKVDKVIVVGSPKLKEDYEKQEGERGHTTQVIENLLTRINRKGMEGIIPLWFEGRYEESFPEAFASLPQQDLGKNYFLSFFDLLMNFHALNPYNNSIQTHKDNFDRQREALSQDILKQYGEKLLHFQEEQAKKDREEINSALFSSINDGQNEDKYDWPAKQTTRIRYFCCTKNFLIPFSILIGAILVYQFCSILTYIGLASSMCYYNSSPIDFSQNQALYCIQGKCSSSLDEIYNVPNIFHNFTTAVHRERFFETLYRTLEKQEGEITQLDTSQKSLFNSQQQFAQAYDKLCQRQFNLVWWFNASANLDQQYQKLAQLLKKGSNLQMWNKGLDLSSQIKNLEGDTVKKIKDSLEVTKYQWLLIFDNIENEETIKEYIPQKHNPLSQGYIIKIENNTQLDYKTSLSLNFQKFNKLRNYCASGVYELPNKTYQASLRIWETRSDNPIISLQDEMTEFMEYSPEVSNKTYLTVLWEEFNRKKEQNKSYKVVLTGMGGLGKSSLALAYAHEAYKHNAYGLIYWINSETDDALNESYKSILRRLKVLPSESSPRINEELKAIKQGAYTKDKWLLIYDNVPNSDFLINKIPQHGVDVIITSRSRIEWPLESYQPIDLSVFRPEDSLNYLYSLTKIEPTLENSLKGKELAEELGHLPLALSYATSYINYKRGANKNYSFADYLREFNQNTASDFEAPGYRRNKNYNSKARLNYDYLIAKTWELSGGIIEPSAYQLMIYFSYLEPDKIIKEAFLEDIEDKFASENALEELNALSLIKVSDPYASMHRLLQSAIRAKNEKESFENTINILNDILSRFYKHYVKLDSKVDNIKNLKISIEQDLYDLFTNLELNLRTVYGHIDRLSKSCNENGDVWLKFKFGAKAIYQLLEDSQKHLSKYIFTRLEQNNSNDMKPLPIKILKATLIARGIEMKESEVTKIQEYLPSILSLDLNKENTKRICEYIIRKDLSIQERAIFVNSLKGLLEGDIKDKDDFIRILFEDVNIDIINQIYDIIFLKSTENKGLGRVHFIFSHEIAEYINRTVRKEYVPKQEIVRTFVNNQRNKWNKLIDCFKEFSRNINALEAAQYNIRSKSEDCHKLFFAKDINHEKRLEQVLMSDKTEWKNKIVSYSIGLGTSEMRPLEQHEIIIALSQVDPTLLDQFVNDMQYLLPADIPIHDRIEAIATSSKIKAVNWPTFVKELKNLFEKVNFVINQAKIMMLLGEIDPSQWVSVITSIQYLLANNNTPNFVEDTYFNVGTNNFNISTLRKELIMDLLSIKAENRPYACQQLKAFWEFYLMENLQTKDQWYTLVINENIQKKGHINIVKALSKKL